MDQKSDRTQYMVKSINATEKYHFLSNFFKIFYRSYSIFRSFKDGTSLFWHPFLYTNFSLKKQKSASNTLPRIE